MENMDDFKQIFFTECAELLVDMEERLLKFDTETADSEQLNAIFRCAHSIKGGAGAFGMNRIMQFTHSLEALLDLMREGKLVASRDVIDALLKSADIVAKMLEAARENREPAADLGADMLVTLQSFMEKDKSASVTLAVQKTPESAKGNEREHTYEIHFAPHKELFHTGNEPLIILRELARLGEAEITPDIGLIPDLEAMNVSECAMRWTIILKTERTQREIAEVFEFVEHISDLRIACLSVAEPVVPLSPALPEEKPSQAAALKNSGAPVPAPAQAPSAATSIRVDLEKVDRLVNMIGELVITEAMIRAQVRHLLPEQFAGLLRGVDELSHHTRELQEAVMAVRMQPVKSVFSRMPRIVRDTSAQLGKDIQLLLAGENTEVDKTVIEQLGDPLTHMIRNSVDHGIEMPEKRRESGKPAQGTIRLAAYHRSGRIIIEIKDDGAGISRERVLAKAHEKGLVAPEANLTDEEIDHLIFLPGFSTAEKVTSVSGRGVGMDVVKRNIEGLGGTVRIANHPGKGSTFTVSLPLTLAILDGMIVRVGAENYIVPITSIIETMRPKTTDVQKVQGRSDVIDIRGEFIPLIYLHRIFTIAGAELDPGKALIVLVESGAEKMGLVVDELVGQQQVVIKSLEANSDPVKGISGATILGDGKVSLILEINELRQLCQVLPKLSIVKAA